LSLRNKLVLYTQILKPVWTYGIQLWGWAAQSTIAVIQHFQNKVLRDIVKASWYIRNTVLHRDLNMEMVTASIRRFARKREARLHQHVNVETIPLLDNSALVRRLKRTKHFELVWWFPVLGTLYRQGQLKWLRPNTAGRPTGRSQQKDNLSLRLERNNKVVSVEYVLFINK
jgi:hypothetical protein